MMELMYLNLKTDPKILITKSDGSSLYLTTDLATVLDRIDKYKLIKHYILLIKDKNYILSNFLKQLIFSFSSDKEYSHI